MLLELSDYMVTASDTTTAVAIQAPAVQKPRPGPPPPWRRARAASQAMTIAQPTRATADGGQPAMTTAPRPTRSPNQISQAMTEIRKTAPPGRVTASPRRQTRRAISATISAAARATLWGVLRTVRLRPTIAKAALTTRPTSATDIDCRCDKGRHPPGA